MAGPRGTLGTWAALAGAGLRAQMQYKMSFALRTLADFFVIISDFAPVWLLTQHFGNLEGWSFAELALLYGMVGMSWGLVELSLRGFEDFHIYLLEGHLDRWLLRPRPVVLQIAAHDFQARKLGRVLQAFAVLVIAGGVLEIDAAGWAWVGIGIAGGALFFAGVVTAAAASQFWTLGHTSELQNMLTYGGTATLTYPVSIYATWFKRVLIYAIPLAFVNYFPALAALDRTAAEGWPEWVPWLSPVVCAGVLAFGLFVFGRGLRRYESTGT